MNDTNNKLPERPSSGSILVALYSATGVGLMVGILLGLSISPVVAAFVGAVGAALAVLLGLNDTHFSIAKGLRIGTFGLMCIAGVFIGLFVRTHDLMGPSLEEKKQSYSQAGFSKEEVLALIKSELSDNNVSNVKRTVLFSNEISHSQCDVITPGNDAELSWVDFSGNFTLEEGFWSSLANNAVSLNLDDDRKATLVSVRDVLCGADTISFSASECALVDELNAQSTVNAQLLSSMNKLDAIRNSIVENVSLAAQNEAYSVVLQTISAACNQGQK